MGRPLLHDLLLSKLQVTGYKLQLTRYKLQATSRQAAVTNVVEGEGTPAVPLALLDEHGLGHLQFVACSL